MDHIIRITLVLCGAVLATSWVGCAAGSHQTCVPDGCLGFDCFDTSTLPRLATEHHEKCTYNVELPCYGYHPTCWRPWPGHCPPCQPQWGDPEQTPYGSTDYYGVPPAESIDTPPYEMENASPDDMLQAPVLEENSDLQLDPPPADIPEDQQGSDLDVPLQPTPPVPPELDDSLKLPPSQQPLGNEPELDDDTSLPGKSSIRFIELENAALDQSADFAYHQQSNEADEDSDPQAVQQNAPRAMNVRLRKASARKVRAESSTKAQKSSRRVSQAKPRVTSVTLRR